MGYFYLYSSSRNNCVVIGNAFDDQTIFHLDSHYYFSSLYYTEKIYRLGKAFADVLSFFRDHKIYGKNDITHFVPFDSSL